MKQNIHSVIINMNELESIQKIPNISASPVIYYSKNKTHNLIRINCVGSSCNRSCKSGVGLIEKVSIEQVSN